MIIHVDSSLLNNVLTISSHSALVLGKYTPFPFANPEYLITISAYALPCKEK